MSWKTLLQSVSGLINDHIQLRNDYLMAENRILRNQIEGRVQLTDGERRELAEIGVKLGKQALAEIATVAQPDTILAWNRKFTVSQVDPSEPPKSVGRPRVDPEIEEWVIRMARENRSWGYDRIQGSLNHLGYTISDQTVGNILKRHGIPPAPERKKTITWGEFVRSHWDVLVATGFFDSEVWSRLGQIISFLLIVIHFGCHVVRAVGMSLHQQRQGIQALIRFHTLIPHVPRLVRGVQTRSRAVRVSERVLGKMTYEVKLVDLDQHRSQHAGKIVDLSEARHWPIRDGPMRLGQRRGGQLTTGPREAA